MWIQYKRLSSNAKIPKRAYQSAGFDLWPVGFGQISPGERVTIPLGFAAAFEPGYVAVIDDKSGVGNKGLTHLAGVIDSDYRGEWLVIMHNMSNQVYFFSPEKSIAQVLFLKVEPVEEKIVEELPESDRGDKKFGSSEKSTEVLEGYSFIDRLV